MFTKVTLAAAAPLALVSLASLVSLVSLACKAWDEERGYHPAPGTAQDPAPYPAQYAAQDPARRPGQVPPQEPAQDPESPTPASTVPDEAYARRVWDAIQGYTDWKLASDFYPGEEPHGAVLRIYSTWIEVDGKHLPIVVKDNFAGDAEAVKAAPAEHLAAVTVMVQRPGYDTEHGDWFWAQYGPDGQLGEGTDSKPLAGKVESCIRCHSSAGGDDYLFHNDR